MIDLLAENDIIGAFGMAVLLASCAGIGSLVLGTVIAMLRISSIRTCQLLGGAYVNTVRNTPLVLIIIACNIVMSVNLGLNFTDDFGTNNVIWAIIGLSLYHGALVCEALRSGVNTIPQGQAEAARSIGLTPGHHRDRRDLHLHQLHADDAHGAARSPPTTHAPRSGCSAGAVGRVTRRIQAWGFRSLPDRCSSTPSLKPENPPCRVPGARGFVGRSVTGRLTGTRWHGP
jgi:His/Glu/Gln/Arg/opine family amino acid ABC transporter permease subunit